MGTRLGSCVSTELLQNQLPAIESGKMNIFTIFKNRDLCGTGCAWVATPICTSFFYSLNSQTKRVPYNVMFLVSNGHMKH